MLDSTTPGLSPATDRPQKITTLPHNSPSCAPVNPRRFVRRKMLAFRGSSIALAARHSKTHPTSPIEKPPPSVVKRGRLLGPAKYKSARGLAARHHASSHPAASRFKPRAALLDTGSTAPAVSAPFFLIAGKTEDAGSARPAFTSPSCAPAPRTHSSVIRPATPPLDLDHRKIPPTRRYQPRSCALIPLPNNGDPR